jgi:Bacterial archaeo-eukaryotic release factor family 7
MGACPFLNNEKREEETMAILNSIELQSLITETERPCVSIYLPTHRKGPQIEQDRIRLKNLLKKAEKLLASGGMRGTEIDPLLNPARKLLEDSIFWRHQSDGLALFMTAGKFHTYRLPYHFSEVVVVTDRYHVKPLLPVLADEAQFYVLAFSQKQVRLLQGSTYSVSEIDVEGVSTSLADTLDPNRNRNHIQFHTGAPSHGSGKRDAIYHGSGFGDEDRKKAIQKFFAQVDRGVTELLKDNPGPLVLAGVDYLLPLYREVSKYPNLVGSGITGNFDVVAAEELHRLAWEQVEPLLTEARRKDWARFVQLKETDSNLVSDIVRDVVRSALGGRIDSLFVADDVQHWGTVDFKNHEVEIHDGEQSGDCDLLDLAAVHTLTKGGAVYIMHNGDASGDIAAIYRY